MKKWVLFKLFSCLALVASAQEGVQVGLAVSTGAQLNTHRSKTTGIWSSQTGYGFSIGLPVKSWRSATTAIHTGLDYEYTAFDNRVNNTLVSSVRYHALHVPLTYNYQILSNWFLTGGTGLDFFIASRNFTPGNTVNIASITNPFQPYVSLGISAIAERGTGYFELGAQARYHFLDLWKKTYPEYEATSSKLLSLDLLMRFYF